MARSREETTSSADGSQLVVPVQSPTDARARRFEAAYRAHYQDVFRYVLALIGSPHDAEDVVAEAFERAYRARRAVPDPALPWLLLTSRRIATDRWRRARRLAALVFGMGRTSRIEVSERQTDFWLWFNALAEVLTERQREVLVLRYQHDLTEADIAQVMGLSVSGVRSLIQRALAALRSHPELLA